MLWPPSCSLSPEQRRRHRPCRRLSNRCRTRQSRSFGYEDQVAANLIYQGFVLEGLAATKAVRDRHDGRDRNPYSQLQAGNYYARSLANYSQLLAVTGYRYSAVEKAMWLAPKVRRDDLRMFFSTGTAWGTITLERSDSGAIAVRIEPAYGSFELRTLTFDDHAYPLDKKRLQPGAGAVVVVNESTTKTPGTIRDN